MEKTTEAKGKVDYSLYLVTDSTPAILGNRDLVSIVKDAIIGGRV
jgi:thiamine-phosphate diphosphorylase / hydroxyethylthiazole kinase